MTLMAYSSKMNFRIVSSGEVICKDCNLRAVKEPELLMYYCPKCRKALAAVEVQKHLKREKSSQGIAMTKIGKKYIAVAETIEKVFDKGVKL